MMEVEELNRVTERIIGIAIEVHKKLGPGFIEKVYQQALALEFGENNLKFEREKVILIDYKGHLLGEQRIDFLIDNSIILEIKAVEEIGRIHVAQLLSYLKTNGNKLGLILNFANSKLGIKRVIT